MVCWFLIAEYFFYATGHQPSFSTIHWDAAFIGFDNTLQINIVRSILIGRYLSNEIRFIILINSEDKIKFLCDFKNEISTLGINTFGSYMILGMTVPLLVIAPFSLRLMFPLMMKSLAPEDEKKRGELLLFECNEEFHAELFSASGKYIIFHGFRVSTYRKLNFKFEKTLTLKFI